MENLENKQNIDQEERDRLATVYLLNNIEKHIKSLREAMQLLRECPVISEDVEKRLRIDVINDFEIFERIAVKLIIILMDRLKEELKEAQNG